SGITSMFRQAAPWSCTTISEPTACAPPRRNRLSPALTASSWRTASTSDISKPSSALGYRLAANWKRPGAAIPRAALAGAEGLRGGRHDERVLDIFLLKTE